MALQIPSSGIAALELKSRAEPSCVSVKSDSSMEESLKFSTAAVPSDPEEFPPLLDPPIFSRFSCVSIKRDQPMEKCLTFSIGEGEPSCASVKSDSSMEEPLKLSTAAVPSDPKVQRDTSELTRRNMESLFQELEHKVISLVRDQLRRFVKLMSPACSENKVEDEEEQSSVREGALNITLYVLSNMNQTELANTLQTKLAPPCHQKLKMTLKEKFQKINEGLSNPGTSVFLNDMYTDLYITEGGSGEINNEHEVRQIETRRPATQEIPIKCNDIFKDKSVRTVLTKGIAGIGKTVSVQKFILDWAEGKANQDVLFIFPLPFRELNLMKEKQISMLNLLHQFFTDTKELKPRDYYHYKLLFIFDGLDECRLPLDFQNNKKISDVTQSASVDVLLTNLIKGNLLPSALIWITTRPAAASQILLQYINQLTEVRGFSDPQREEYFRKRISDQTLANKIITHVTTSRSLYIMCHIPVFCWIAATVLETLLGEAESGEIPKTLTQMFTHFLVFQIKHSSQKYQGKCDSDHDKTRKIIFSLGQLAFQQLERGNLIFYEEDLRECDIDIKELAVDLGVCTQIFREEFGLQPGKIFSFVHLSVQEFLAALYAFLYFISNNRNVLVHQDTGLLCYFRKSTMSDFLKAAVDKALESESGHLDLFLRFLLGLSLESNQTFFQDLLTQTRSSSHNKEEIVQHIKEKIRENPSPEKTINLFHCLNELNDHSLVQEVQTYLNRGSFSGAKLSPAQWSAVAFVLLNSEELDEFDLRKYGKSEECLLRLLPVVKASRKAILAGCNITKNSCEALCSVLQSTNSLLKELDLSNNDLQDSGVEQLSDGLKSSHCNLEILRLSGCMITEEGCSALASALKSNPFHLRELDLTYNHPGDSGVKLLSNLLADPQCKLEKLQVEHGGRIRMKPGLKKYACELTLDPNTAHTRLFISEGNRKVECLKEMQPYPHHQDRFDYFPQVLGLEGLTGRCYWEAEWSGLGEGVISMSYRKIGRKGDSDDCVLGFNNHSWRLDCINKRYFVKHNKQETAIPDPPSGSNRIGVYLDWAAGTLSFYSISRNTQSLTRLDTLHSKYTEHKTHTLPRFHTHRSKDPEPVTPTLTHLHTFYHTFTEPLYAGFWVWGFGSSVRVRQIE